MGRGIEEDVLAARRVIDDRLRVGAPNQAHDQAHKSCSQKFTKSQAQSVCPGTKMVQRQYLHCPKERASDHVDISALYGQLHVY